MVLCPTSWERTAMGHVSTDPPQGAADLLPLLSPLACPQPPVRYRADTETRGYAGRARKASLPSHCWSRLQAGRSLLLL